MWIWGKVWPVINLCALRRMLPASAEAHTSLTRDPAFRLPVRDTSQHISVFHMYCRDCVLRTIVIRVLVMSFTRPTVRVSNGIVFSWILRSCVGCPWKWWQSLCSVAKKRYSWLGVHQVWRVQQKDLDEWGSSESIKGKNRTALASGGRYDPVYCLGTDSLPTICPPTPTREIQKTSKLGPSRRKTVHR